MSSILIGKKKYLFAVALAVLVCFSGFFYYAFESMQESLVKEKYIGRKMLIDLMCDALDTFVTVDNDWDTYNYRDTLIKDIEQIDKATGTYAEIFDEQMNNISTRTKTFIEHPFDIKKLPGIVNILQSMQSGETVISWSPDVLTPPYDIYIYWRWIPTDNTLQNRLLVVLGTSKYSVDVGFASWIGYGVFIFTIITTFLILSCIVLLCQLGGVYNKRAKDGKWKCSNCSLP